MSNDKGKAVGGKTRCPCVMCSRDTNHTLLATVTDTGSVEDHDIYYSHNYDIVRCDGLETIRFRLERSNSEDIDNESGEPNVSVEIYPEPDSDNRAGAAYITDEVYSMPQNVQAIYSETLAAIGHRLPILAGIGIRAIVEVTCEDQKAEGKSLYEMIDDLASRSLLTEAGAEILHGLRVLGNRAAHEMSRPTEQQVAAAMKVIDHLLIGAYVLPKEAKVLPVPEREHGTKAGTAAVNSAVAPSRGCMQPHTGEGGSE